MDIEFSDVHFSYEEDREILKGINMEFPAGSFTSIVGTSGCGKSTTASILMGRNKGYQGSVTIEGKELSEIQENSLMDQITMVSHNSYLFKGTVEDNLRMGKPDATEEEMQDALEKGEPVGLPAGTAGTCHTGHGERKQLLRRPVSETRHCTGASPRYAGLHL